MVGRLRVLVPRSCIAHAGTFTPSKGGLKQDTSARDPFTVEMARLGVYIRLNTRKRTALISDLEEHELT